MTECIHYIRINVVRGEEEGEREREGKEVGVYPLDKG